MAASLAGSWQPVTTRSTLNPHYLDPVTGAPSRDAIPQTPARFGRTLRRVLQHGIQQVRLEWRNVYCQVDDPGEVDGPNPVWIRASIEYPAGAWRQVNGSTTWSATTAYAVGDQVLHDGVRYVAGAATTAGQSPAAGGPWRPVRLFPVTWTGTTDTATVQPGQTVMSDPIDLSDVRLLAGERLAVGLLAFTGGVGSIVSGADAIAGDFVCDFPTAPWPGAADDLVVQPVTDQTSMPVGTPLPMPTVVEGLSPNPNTVMALGDSLFQGLYDSDIDGDTGGFIPRALRATQHYRMSVSGQRADSLSLPTQVTTWRDELLARYNVVITDLGGNDAVRSDGTTDISSNTAMVQARMTALWRYLAQRCPNVWATTITPWTASTDGWSTLAGQSRANQIMGGTNGLDGVWGRLRTWFRDGCPIQVFGRTVRAGEGEHPLAGIVDVGYAITDPASGWKWKAGLTTDGMHPTAAGHQLMATALTPYLPALARGGRIEDLPAGSFGGRGSPVPGWCSPCGTRLCRSRACRPRWTSREAVPTRPGCSRRWLRGVGLRLVAAVVRR
ncbi:GDSL-type esterase/lipase family protein [Saccharopolyspora pogona]|uniref:GDSL-type esterase/lipase family protein n=1 Tax=Saccharopolyspora pogona TaxID=333966 RepID=UPI001681F464|nr:GDSL-type esterase/lipase family protein [Saccharopolyspora pogona]